MICAVSQHYALRFGCAHSFTTLSLRGSQRLFLIHLLRFTYACLREKRWQLSIGLCAAGPNHGQATRPYANPGINENEGALLSLKASRPHSACTSLVQILHRFFFWRGKTRDLHVEHCSPRFDAQRFHIFGVPCAIEETSSSSPEAKGEICLSA